MAGSPNSAAVRLTIATRLREISMRYGANLPGVLIAAAASVATAAPSGEAERQAAEISNLRALPFGFAAWCDNGTLRMNREGGAVFRVSDSAICRLIPDGHFACTADPDRERQPDGAPVRHCNEFDLPEPGDAI